jgi:putative Holliday junction resolvase
MRVLGVDLGHKRIGLALSDTEAEFAFPAGTLSSKGRKQDLAALCSLIVEREVGRVVVGLPRHMDGRIGPEAEAAESFARALETKSGVRVETLDERWTSQEAERSLRDQGQSARRARQHVDEVAASIILRTYLELKRTELGRAEAPVAEAVGPADAGDID